MVVFQDIEEVEEWLEPLSYIDLWEAVAPYNVFTIAEREHCDGLISSGKVKPELILKGLKNVARSGLTARFGLSYRRYETIAKQGQGTLH